MTVERDRVKQVLREARRIVLVPAIIWIVYLAIAAIYGASTERGGLVSPDGLDLGIVLLGAATLALKLVAIFVLPAVVVFRLSSRLLRPRRNTASAAPERHRRP